MNGVEREGWLSECFDLYSKHEREAALRMLPQCRHRYSACFAARYTHAHVELNACRCDGEINVGGRDSFERRSEPRAEGGGVERFDSAGEGESEVHVRLIRLRCRWRP